MSVRPKRGTDDARLSAMVRKLLPQEPHYDFRDEQVFVWEGKDGSLGAFASVSVRPWSMGCSSEPCPHVETWYV
jgi:hypothetical protein